MPKKIKNVVFSKHDDWCMGKNKSFWRADLGGVTIATLCRTKTECVAEVRRKLKKINNSAE